MIGALPLRYARSRPAAASALPIRGPPSRAVARAAASPSCKPASSSTISLPLPAGVASNWPVRTRAIHSTRRFADPVPLLLHLLADQRWRSFFSLVTSAAHASRLDASCVFGGTRMYACMHVPPAPDSTATCVGIHRKVSRIAAAFNANAVVVPSSLPSAFYPADRSGGGGKQIYSHPRLRSRRKPEGPNDRQSQRTRKRLAADRWLEFAARRLPVSCYVADRYAPLRLQSGSQIQGAGGSPRGCARDGRPAALYLLACTC